MSICPRFIRRHFRIENCTSPERKFRFSAVYVNADAIIRPNDLTRFTAHYRQIPECVNFRIARFRDLLYNTFDITFPGYGTCRLKIGNAHRKRQTADRKNRARRCRTGKKNARNPPTFLSQNKDKSDKRRQDNQIDKKRIKPKQITAQYPGRKTQCK